MKPSRSVVLGRFGIRATDQHRRAAVGTDLSEASDAALVVAIGRWRHEALAEAYRRHGGAVYALARRVGPAPVAEEVAQDVFLRLWTRPERFDPERGTLRSFLLADTHGRAVDLLRSESARRERERGDARRTAAGGYRVEDEVMDLTLAEHVKAVVAVLPKAERQAIELAYFGGLTYKEVARALDEPEGTTKARIRAGLKRMRAQLADVGIGGAWEYS